MILFLDFDGVLHPATCDRREWFCRLPLLEGVLRQHPHVEVVISSSWRYDHTLEQLRGFFAPDLHARIVGTTAKDAPPFPEAWMPEGLLPCHHREIECWKWIELNRDRSTPWLAIDDSPDWFLPDCRNLMITDSRLGLMQRQTVQLAVMMS